MIKNVFLIYILQYYSSYKKSWTIKNTIECLILFDVKQHNISMITYIIQLNNLNSVGNNKIINNDLVFH